MAGLPSTDRNTRRLSRRIGAIVTERVFNVPGIGTLLFNSINAGEAPMIVSLVTLLVIIFLLSNLVVDLLYGVLDPRIRYAK